MNGWATEVWMNWWAGKCSSGSFDYWVYLSLNQSVFTGELQLMETVLHHGNEGVFLGWNLFPGLADVPGESAVSRVIPTNWCICLNGAPHVSGKLRKDGAVALRRRNEQEIEMSIGSTQLARNTSLTDEPWLGFILQRTLASSGWVFSPVLGTIRVADCTAWLCGNLFGVRCTLQMGSRLLCLAPGRWTCLGDAGEHTAVTLGVGPNMAH